MALRRSVKVSSLTVALSRFTHPCWLSAKASADFAVAACCNSSTKRLFCDGSKTNGEPPLSSTTENHHHHQQKAKTTFKGGLLRQLRHVDSQLQDVVEIISPGPLRDANKIDPGKENRLMQERSRAREEILKAGQLWSKIHDQEDYTR